MEYVVNFTWDDETAVWIATSEDIKGLVLESGSIDALIERVRFAVPELLALNKKFHHIHLNKRNKTPLRCLDFIGV